MASDEQGMDNNYHHHSLDSILVHTTRPSGWHTQHYFHQESMAGTWRCSPHAPYRSIACRDAAADSIDKSAFRGGAVPLRL